ncbi:MAG: hypothetical protein WC659_04195 [Patescibacteria group bacterium]
MKRFALLLGMLISLQSYAIQRLQVEVKGDSVWMKCKNSVQTFYTPGYHSADSTLGVLTFDSVAVRLPELGRNNSCGQHDGIGLYHLTSGLVPEKFGDNLQVTFRASGKVIFCRGEIFREEAELEFPNLFTAREFPIFWADSTNYSVDYFPLNNLDTVRTVFIWTDSGKALLDSARILIAEAIREVGNYAPQFWHKHLQNWGGSHYTLTVMLGTPYIGLEHLNTPFAGVSKEYLPLLKPLIVHEMFHSFVGKSLMPASYVNLVGYHPTDALGFYEGLTTFISQRYTIFPVEFIQDLTYSWMRTDMSKGRDLIELSYVPGELESPYWNGRIFWIAMIGKINIDDWLEWMFEKKLIDRNIPISVSMDSIYTWLSDYKAGVGDYAQRIIHGEYYHDADSLLQYHGYRKTYLRDYSINYIGPYYWRDGKVGGYIYEGMDQYHLPLDYKFSCILSGSDSLSLGPNGDGMKLLRQFPDSLFSVLVTSSRGREVIKLSKNLYFPSGESYYFEGKIHFAQVPLARREETLKFWRQLVRQ